MNRMMEIGSRWHAGRLARSVCLAVALIVWLTPGGAGQAPTLGGVLEAGLQVKEWVSTLSDMLNIIHRPLLQFGHEITLDVTYEKTDGPCTDQLRLAHCLVLPAPACR
jgi:hypothetical protein